MITIEVSMADAAALEVVLTEAMHSTEFGGANEYDDEFEASYQRGRNLENRILTALQNRE